MTSKNRFISFHRKMDKFVFNEFVNNNESLPNILDKFSSFKSTFNNKINPFLYTDSYCNEYITNLYNKMVKNKAEKENGFVKKDSFIETVVHRFVRNKKNWAFLPQKNIAKAIGCSQKTVSIKLKKMVEDKYLVVRKRYHSMTHKATEYFLGVKGLEIYNVLMGFVFKTKEKTKQMLYNIYKGIKQTWGQFIEEYREDRRKNLVFYYESIGEPCPDLRLILDKVVNNIVYKFKLDSTDWVRP